MSDNEKSKPASNNTNNGRVHFGSLENKINLNRSNIENKRKRPTDIPSDEDSENDEDNEIELDDLASDNMIKSSEEQSRILAEFERRNRARNLAVPTDDNRVKARLRELGEPICLFGEGPGERRDRLRGLLSNMDPDAPEFVKSATGTQMGSPQSDSDSEDEEFFTEGSQSLREARKQIAVYSLNQAKTRVELAKQDYEKPFAKLRELQNNFYKSLNQWNIFGSQIGDDRPLTCIKFSPDSKLICNGSMSGLIKLWQVPNCTEVRTLRGHTDRVSGISFHPQSTIGLSESAVNIASGGSDNKILLWNLEKDTPLECLEGHVSRVSKVEFHPHGKWLASASFDATWRLWDIETTEELLLQEGHQKEVYTLGFHPDGSLISTGGLDCVGRVWDLRTGRSIMNITDHVKDLLACDFSPNGYQLATGSADNTIKIYDLRQMKTIYTIPAHVNLISDLKFFKGSHILKSELFDTTLDITGGYLMSSSFDGTIKVWSSTDFKLLKSINAHEGKVMGLDISRDNQYWVTSGYDRTFKLWSNDGMDY